ncbi:MAG: 2-dehydropantoate 2-reductase [Planctomycetota bacterium]|nr:2-dehydropantoate 2-reductase [Planctomycetota bacterium]
MGRQRHKVHSRNRRGDAIKICIVGPGAIGRLFASLFSKSGADVVLADHRPERAESLTRNGLILRGLQEIKTQVPVTMAPSDFAPFDLVFICVKSYSTKEVAKQIVSWASNSTLVTLQNGMGNIEALLEYFPPEQIIGGVTGCGANIPPDSPETVIFAGCGETVIGQVGTKSLNGRNKELERVESLFRKAGLPVRKTENLQSELWGKLLINAAINPLCALLRIRNGFLPKIPSLWELARLVLKEAISVANAEGVVLPYPDAAEKVKAVCEATAQNRCSTLQDVEKGKRTEIDSINGYICRIGEKHGIPTPYNLTLNLLLGSQTANAPGY